MIKNKAVINEESSSTIHLLKQELRRTKKDLAEQTNQLKIAQEQLCYLRESIPEAPNEQSLNESSILCRACRREITGEEADIQLHFADTSGLGIIGHTNTD